MQWKCLNCGKKNAGGKLKKLIFSFFLLNFSIFWAFGGLKSYIGGIKSVSSALSGNIGADSEIAGLSLSGHKQLLAESIKQTYQLYQQTKAMEENLKRIKDNFEDGVLIPSLENIDQTCEFIENFNKPAYYMPGINNGVDGIEDLLINTDKSLDIWMEKGPFGYKKAIISAGKEKKYENSFNNLDTRSNELDSIDLITSSKINLNLGAQKRIKDLINYYKTIFIPNVKKMIEAITKDKNLTKGAKASLSTLANMKLDYANESIIRLSSNLLELKDEMIEISSDIKEREWQRIVNKSATDGTKGKVLCYGYFDYQPRLNVEQYLKKLTTKLSKLYE